MSSFIDIGVEQKIIDAITELGFSEPMPVQTEVIPQLLNEEVKDIIALAQTGTGKTAAFGIPLIQKSNGKSKKVKHLILSPTRELCLQIADDLRDFSNYKSNVKIAAVFGGSSIDKQIQKLKRGVHIISATPGRLVDLIKRKNVDLSEIETLVLDEADEMLNMGFRDELDAIIDQIPKERTTLLFSATMPKEVLAMTKKYMKSPMEITIGKRNTGAKNINHQIYFVQAKDRYLALKRIVDFHPNIYGIVFCRTRRETQEIAEKLIKDGYQADSIHGDLSQAQRDNVMGKFRIKHLRLLVATDVAARGLDVNDLTHIINYNLPDELETYTHRSGRTGRAGKFGCSIVIANLKEKNKIKIIEEKLGRKFEFKSVPLGKEVCEKQLFHLIDRMEKVEVDHTQIETYLPEITKKLEWLDREELIKKFVSVEFNRFLDYYRNVPDLNKPSSKRNKGESRGTSANMSRFFINLGKTDDLKPTSVIGLIKDNSGNKEIEIGEIEIKQNFSFFETEKEFEEKLLQILNKRDFNGRKIVLEIASQKKNNGNTSKGKKNYSRNRRTKKDWNNSSEKGSRRRKKRRN